MIVGHNFCRLETYFPMFEWVWFWRRYKGRSSVFRPGQDVSIVQFSPEPWIINSKSAANWFELSRTTFVFPPKRNCEAMENANLANSIPRCQQHAYVVCCFCMNIFGCNLLVIHRLNMFWLAWHQSGSRWRVQIFWVSGWQLPGSGPTSDPLSVFSLLHPQQMSRYQEHSRVSAWQYCNDQHISQLETITGEPWACSGQEAIM